MFLKANIKRNASKQKEWTANTIEPQLYRMQQQGTSIIANQKAGLSEGPYIIYMTQCYWGFTVHGLNSN